MQRFPVHGIKGFVFNLHGQLWGLRQYLVTPEPGRNPVSDW